jgi:uncharacterized protein (TIGR00645 family)
MIERILEGIIFGSRWLLAPIYLGLIGGLCFLVAKFVQEFFHIVPTVFTASETDIILAVLSLVDISLAGNLLVMVIFAGYENFVSKIDCADSADRPEWMGKVDDGGLKLKMIASIVAISAIQLLKAFLHVQDLTQRDLAWMLGLHMAFVISGVLLAVMDRIARSPDEMAEAHVRAQMLLSGEIQPHGHAPDTAAEPRVERRAADSPMRGSA